MERFLVARSGKLAASQPLFSFRSGFCASVVTVTRNPPSGRVSSFSLSTELGAAYAARGLWRSFVCVLETPHPTDGEASPPVDEMVDQVAAAT
jgi:hypothetical protein